MYCMTRTSTCTCTCKFSCVCNSRRCCHKVCTLIIHIVWKKIHLHMHSIYMYMYIVHANVYPLQALLLCIHLSIKHTYIKKNCTYVYTCTVQCAYPQYAGNVYTHVHDVHASAVVKVSYPLRSLPSGTRSLCPRASSII